MIETITTKTAQVDKDRKGTVKKKNQLQMKEDNVHRLKLTEKNINNPIDNGFSFY